MHTVRTASFVVALLLASLIAALAVAQHHPVERADPDHPGFPDLAAALQATPGVLGVETAIAPDGRKLWFAWFNDKQAIWNWYYDSDHMRTMGGVLTRKEMTEDAFARRTIEGPLARVPDDAGPILVVTAVGFENIPAGDGERVATMSIELYTPVEGGMFMGRRWAPEAAAPEAMIEYADR